MRKVGLVPMIRNVGALVCLLIIFFTDIGQTVAEQRVALVIGNSAYQHVPKLANPGNDAAQIASLFRRLDFDVLHENDLSKDAMDKTLATFATKARGADIAVVFFAGHGLEVEGNNYLIPVDSQLETDRALAFRAVSLSNVMYALEEVKGVRMVLLDACRDNPFNRTMKRSSKTRSISRGLAKVQTSQEGTVISFATRAGDVASDGEGDHSPYTTALLENLPKPGIDIGLMLRKVRASVVKATKGAQEPFISNALPGNQTFLVAPRKIEPVTANTAPATQSPATGFEKIEREVELELWKATAKAKTAKMVKVFLKRYPRSDFAPAAKQLLKALTVPDASTADLETPPSERDRRALIRDVQTALSDRGCNAGRADGFWGRKGKRALRAFNRETGKRLSVNSPTESTLAAIRREEGQVCTTVARTEPVAKPPKKKRKETRAERRKRKAREARKNRKQVARTKPRKERTRRKSTKRKTTKRKATTRPKRKVARTSSGSARRAGCVRLVRRGCVAVFGSGAGLSRCLAQGNSRCRRNFP